MIKNYIYLLILLLSNAVFGQEQPNLRERANKLYNEYNYAQAADLYLKLAKANKAKQKELERLANSYRLSNNYENAEKWYAILLEKYPNSNKENLYYYGQTLKNVGKYPEAKKVLTDYMGYLGSDAKLKNELIGCDSALLWYKKPTVHQLQNQDKINTANAQFSVFSYDQKVYYVGEPERNEAKEVYGRTGKPYLRVYSADRDENLLLTNPVLDRSFDYHPKFHVGPITGNSKGDVFYVTRTYSGPKGLLSKEGKKKYKTNNLELFVYSKNNDKWDIKPFAYNNVKKYSVGHAVLSADEKTLYFVSDMPQGFGGTDIWFCELQDDGSWGHPQNAGNMINTEGNEKFPTIAADGILYYSTDGLPGMGGLDIFKTNGSRTNWTKPENLKYPLNSANDDFSFVSFGNSGYLSSNRIGGIGSDDIYSYLKPKLIFTLEGMVYNKKDRSTVAETEISIYGKDNVLLERKLSDNNGKFYYELSEDESYKVSGIKKGFLGDSTYLNTTDITNSDTLKIALQLDPLLEKGKTIVLENIHYNFDKASIRKDAAIILDRLVKTLEENPTLKIELASHTDSRGSDRYNMELSQKRAQSAVNYLVKKGIDRERLVAKGYGETRLLNKCSNKVACSAAAHQENRRTEFTILEF